MEYDVTKYRPANKEFWDRDPVFGAVDDPDLRRWGVRVLDPSAAPDFPGLSPRPTYYLARNLLVADSARAAVAGLQELARELGWTLQLDERERFTSRLGDQTVGVQRWTLSQGISPAPPDAWVLLQSARLRAGGIGALTGVTLEHLLEVHPRGHWESNPRGHWESNPRGHWESNPLSVYGDRGEGGRQPVAYTGPRPPRVGDEDWKKTRKGSRPVVGVLDTGCGKHPWLDGVVDEAVTLDGATIGFEGRAEPPDPEEGGDFQGPLDGVIDMLSGHGTFICGLVHQHCPNATILMWRVVPSEGYVPELEFLNALLGIAELSRRHANGEPGGHRLDVLNLSMGFYPETPEEAASLDPTLAQALRILSESGTVVVCSAGNDATARLMLPAAYAGTASGAPIVSVGARNPNGTVALFSNTGDWVTTYAPGASVLSTMPALRGGIEPLARTKAYQHHREGIDPDDFTRPHPGGRVGGFGLWSGTSFSAPLVAGRIAAAVEAAQGSDEEDPSQAVPRAQKAVANALHGQP